MKNSVIKRLTLAIVLLAMVTVFAVPLASAASYSKVYGQTLNRIRVRESASTNAAIIDNVVKGACVYITSSKTSGSNTFVQIKYRASDGSTATGWVCQNDGRTTYVKVLSTQQAKDKYSVSGGDLPSKVAGTFTTAQRKASVSDSETSYIKSGSSGETVKSVQTKLKALGLYSGEITGNVGSKTEAAIKAFQLKYGLTADGIAGPQTLAKIDAVYAQRGGSSSSSSSSGLKLGSQGTDVRNLQQDLTTLGYYWAEITGNFGAKTETAVKRFQEENGLTADGVAGTKTLNAIAAAVARKGGTSASTSTSGTTLKLNSQGTKVTQLQQDLKQLGYYYAEITGNFGEKTEAAVKKFQQAKGLTADGVAGTSTLNAIAAAITAAGGSTSSGTGISGMKLGSTGDDVRALQQNLTTLGYYYGDITGRYGSLTQQAVKKFQKAKGLTADGVAGASTVSAIASAVKSTGATPAGSTGSTTSGALREGDNGTAVTELQTMLKKLGYYYGDITGSFGSLTRQAVRKFQDANDLTVDGIAGTATLNKLRQLTGTTISDGSSSGTTVTTANSYGRITKDNVYLRASYSTTSASKASLSKNTLVRVTKTYTSAGVKWYYITVNMGSYTHNGYVRSDMMEIISESEYKNNGGAGNNYSDQEILGMIKVTGDNVSLRYEPSTAADRVGTANIGDTFYYIDTVAGWFQTQAGYWISSYYAKVMTDEEINNSTPTDENTVYYYGDGRVGNAVIKEFQQALKDLGYYTAEITGKMGAKTEQAVKDFQRDHGLTADGRVGPATLQAIRTAVTGGASGGTGKFDPVIYNPKWPTYYTNVIKQGLSSGSNGATLTDIATGITFTIHVQSAGVSHVDAEPLTAADTAKLCQIYNRSTASSLPYTRRGMVLTVNKMQFVCSIYPQPHGQQDITTNSFEGQFCIHFNGSTKNAGDGGSIVASEDHQAIITKAVTTLKSMKTTNEKGESVTIQVLDKPATW